MGLTLQLATWGDANLLYRWRTGDEASGWWQGDAVTWESHLEWLRDRLHNPAMRLWVASVDGVPVGQARVDSNGELSCSIDEGWRGRGLGTELVREATRLSGWSRLKANVDRGNEAGIATTVAAGFVVRDDVVFLRWPE